MTNFLDRALTPLGHSCNLSKQGSLVSHRRTIKALIKLLLVGGLFSYGVEPATAENILGCQAGVGDRLNISNNAVAGYSDRPNGNNYRATTSRVTSELLIVYESDIALELIPQGVFDGEGNTIDGLGSIVRQTIDLFVQQGLSPEEANLAGIAAISQLVSLPLPVSSLEVAEAVKQSAAAVVEDDTSQNSIAEIPDAELLTILAGLNNSSLRALGLDDSEIAAVNIDFTPEAEDSFFARIESEKKAIAESVEQPVKAAVLAAQEQYETELEQIREGEQSVFTEGDLLEFQYRLDNRQQQATRVELPTAEQITNDALTGSGRVTEIIYRLVDPDGEGEAEIVTPNESGEISIPAERSLELAVEVEVGEISPETVSTIGIDLQTDCVTPTAIQTVNLLPIIAIGDGRNPLIDPLGQITGCAGNILPEYQGFMVALYEPDPSDPTGSSVREITTLTATEVPDDPDNNIPLGITPNTQNSNPFFLTNSDEGRYSFLFDETRGQLDRGKEFILIVSPPEDTIYDERRIKLTIGDREGRIVQYTATSLDGRPIRSDDPQTTISGETVLIEDAERIGLDLAVLDLATNICDAQEIQINKTGDRASAEPGDVVLYRLAIRNLASAAIDNVQITDFLPPGFRFETDSVRAELNETPVAIAATEDGSTINFSSDITLETSEVLNVVYAAEVTPNALRGDGENEAIVSAERSDNGTIVRDGPAIHDLRIEPGIVEDTGVLIGRVFVDHNFDGEQQTGEPGVPNAVIFLEDGNRIITDADGLFSIANILPGIHTGILDLTSIPEYRLAPNLRFSEGNSKSRLVQLEPGGMVRMNFAVTPTATGKEPKSESPARTKTLPQPKKSAPPPETNSPIIAE